MSDAQKIAQTIDIISENLHTKINELINLYIPGGKNIPGLSGTKYIPVNYKLKINESTYTLFDSQTKSNITHIVISNCPNKVKEALEKVNDDLQQQKKYCESNPMLKEWENLLEPNKTQDKTQGELIDEELNEIATKLVDKIYQLMGYYVPNGKNIEFLTSGWFCLSLVGGDVWIYKKSETDVEDKDNIRKIKERLADCTPKYIAFISGKLDGFLELQKGYYENNPKLNELKELNSKL